MLGLSLGVGCGGLEPIADLGDAHNALVHPLIHPTSGIGAVPLQHFRSSHVLVLRGHLKVESEGFRVQCLGFRSLGFIV